MDVAAGTLACGEYQFMARTSQALSAAWFSMAARMVQTGHRSLSPSLVANHRHLLVD